jgi:DNA-directed RNA polymerase subunit K/omega
MSTPSIINNKPPKVISLTDTYNKVNEKKISKPIMTKYEFNQIISQRTTMLAHGAIPLIDVTNYKIKSNIELREIALNELKEGKIPFIIKRPLPNNKYELYRVKDLDLVSVIHMFR